MVIIGGGAGRLSCAKEAIAPEATKIAVIDSKALVDALNGALAACVSMPAEFPVK